MWLARLRTLSSHVFGWAPESNVSSRETAWLDGVRGIAAFLVMVNHYNKEWLSAFAEAPFGATVIGDQNPDGINYHHNGDILWAPWRLPFLRLFVISGGGQVAIFFVLSGIVLSWSPLGKIQTERYDELYHSLGSSVIRRWFRLFLPCAFVSTLYMFLDIYKDWHSALHIIGDYLKETERWANPFDIEHFSILDSLNRFSLVLWTIPVEFAGSIFVYVLLLGFGRVQSFTRRAIAILLVSWYAYAKGQWGLWLFGHGTVIADYVRHSGGFRKISQRSTTTSTISWTLVLLLGFWLMGYAPTGSFWYNRPGYEWMDHLPLPSSFRADVGRAYWGFSGIMVVLACCHLSFMRRFLETALVQYLGKISFMLYLVHYWVYFVVCEPLMHALYSSFCVKELDETFGSEVYRYSFIFNIAAYFIMAFVTCTCCCIVSQVLERWVDRPCTAFGRWIDDKLVHGLQKREKTSLVAEEERELLYTSDPPSSESVEMGQIGHHTEHNSRLISR